MRLIPRSLAIAQPYRGRSLRYYLTGVPGWGRVHEFLCRRRYDRIKAEGHRRLVAGEREGLRFLAAIPHPFSGIGHAFSEWHTGYMWADRIGLEFVNVPLSGNWSQFLGVEKAGINWASVVKMPRLRVVTLPYVRWGYGADAFGQLQPLIDSVRSPDPLLFILADGQNSYDHTNNAVRLRADYLANGRWRSMPSHRAGSRLNVAVHIRRGDVVAMKERGAANRADRLIGEAWFLSVCEWITRRYANGPRPLFNVYSQGLATQFPQFSCRNDVVFHMDEHAQISLHNMATADLLVMSPSGFSYLAALLSGGLRIARAPWWHYLPETEGWLLLREDGRLPDWPDS